MDYSDSELDLDTRSVRDFYPKDPNLTNEKQLLGALHDVLKKLQTKRLPFWEKKFGQVPTLGALHDVLKKLQTKRLPFWEKKFGQVPTCDVGEQCAVRKGARIGKMCDCPRGAFCNSYLLKCL
ncbi:unnamed protein product [Coregonus sp. 'balchen']|nr:unnamed protein product [Coregonus sp. 'balchen']